MTVQPFTLYSTRPDLLGVLAQLRSWGLEVELTGTGDDWRDAKVVLDYEGQPGPLALTFRRDPSYCEEPNWTRHIQGMRDYFRRFPDAPGKDKNIDYLGKLRSALATIWEPDMIETDQRDERIGLMSAVAAQFGCVVFSPSVLRDSSGKFLLSITGEYDPEAQLPPVATGSARPGAIDAGHLSRS